MIDVQIAIKDDDDGRLVLLIHADDALEPGLRQLMAPIMETLCDVYGL